MPIFLYVCSMAAYLEQESRQQGKRQPGGFVDSFLFSCELSSKISSFTFKVDEEDACEHILTMRLISLGDGVKDECNVIEVVCLDRDRKELSIPVANLKLSVQPMVDLGNFELYPPVTFRLKSGSGPVHVSGNHLIVTTNSNGFRQEIDQSVEDVPSNQLPQTIKDSSVIVNT